jgi:beta-mannosidase
VPVLATMAAQYGLISAAVLVLASTAGAPEPTLVEHPIASGVEAQYLDGKWSATNFGGPSAAAGPVAASVPGDILTDLQRVGRTPDPYFNSTWKQPEFVAAWNEGVWTYSTSFDSAVLSDAAGVEHHLLVFDGIRMGAMIKLNGHPLGNATDQFLRYVFEVGPMLKPAGAQNILTVVFGADHRLNCAGRWTRSNQIDWAPVMSTTEKCAPSPGPKHHAVRDTFGFGIWKSVYLLPVPSAAITQLISHTYYAGGHPTSILSDSNHSGFDVNVTAEFIYASNGKLTVIGNWPGAAAVSARVSAGSSHATVSLPAAQTLQARLWHPNGHGEQVRYNLSATFIPDAPAGATPVVASRMIGFRHIALVTIDDTNDTIVAKAPSQNGTGTLTMMFRVNGAATYARGGNKVPMELLDGRMTAVAHRRLVQSAAEGNFNMLRICTWHRFQFWPLLSHRNIL